MDRNFALEHSVAIVVSLCLENQNQHVFSVVRFHRTSIVNEFKLRMKPETGGELVVAVPVWGVAEEAWLCFPGLPAPLRAFLFLDVSSPWVPLLQALTAEGMVHRTSASRTLTRGQRAQRESVVRA